MDSINSAIRSFKETGSSADFKKVYDHVFPNFRYWYRHVQRFTDLDRPSLLCEFQYIVLRAARGFDPSSPVPDGFMRYFRASAKKHALTLRRIYKAQPPCHSLKQDWEVVDPKSFTDTEYVEVIDLVNSCLVGDERMIVLLRLSGEATSGVRDRMGLSEFEYRSALRNIKGNRRLEKALSRYR